MIRRFPFLVLAAGTLGGCHGSSVAGSSADAGANDFVMKSEAFTLAPGDEKYLCYTTHVAEDTTFHSFSIGKYKAVHHVFFARTLAPEPEGPHECPVLFKTSWLPLFTTGTGAATLDLPEGSGFHLAKGDQIVMQLHLLNTGDQTVSEAIEVHAKTLDAANTRYSAALVPFGTTVFDLPPSQKTTVTHDCTMDKDMDAFVAFPHMHQLGKTMEFAVGKDVSSLQTIYKTNYDFNAQRLDPVSFSLHKGDVTRVSCDFDNTTDKSVVYGESTFDEMCFFSLFVKDGAQLDGHCVDMSALAKSTADAGPPPDCHPTTNELGIGAPCTKGGTECATNLACSSDLSSQGGNAGVCISVAKCTKSADCGSGATCCSPAEAGGAVNICIPETCRPASCTPLH